MRASGGVFDFSDIRDALRESRRGFATMRRVIVALMLRETRTRYTDSAIGFGWALVEPIIELGIMIVFFALIKGRTAPIDVPLPVFLITGIFPFSLWRSSMSAGASAQKSNAQLLGYPQVTVIDCIIARVLLESATIFITMQLLIIGMVIFYGQTIPEFYDEPLQIFLSFMVLLALSMGSAILSAGLAELVPIWPMILGWVSRLLWIFSGTFFTLSSLPTSLKAIAIYNPLAHMLDWIRSAMLSAYESDVYSVSYVLTTVVIVLFLGLGSDRIIKVLGRVETKEK